MRLQLTIAVAIVVAMTATAHGQNTTAETGDGTASTRVLVYSDDDATSVVTTAATAEATVAAGFNVGAHALVDVISSASADVVSAATGRWTENRIEAGGRVAVNRSNTTINLGYTQSQENDWASNTLSLAGNRELFQRNTVVSASYTFTHNDVGRAEDPNFERSLDVHTLELGFSQLLDAKTRVGGALTLQLWSGFAASPYRYAPMSDGSRQPERHPDKRRRQAVSGYILRALTPSAAARLSYRFYMDDWGVLAHTASLGFAVQATEWLTATLRGRVYQQNRADFYRQSYAMAMRHMSNDRELATFWDAGLTSTLEAHVGIVDISATAGFIHYRFKNFTPLAKRTALLVGGGAKVDW